MRIAVASQNRKTITEKAGRCRNFWLYDIERGKTLKKDLIELNIRQTLHANHHSLPVALDGVNVLISGGMGTALYHRLMQSGILPIITVEEDPDTAVDAFLANNLDRLPSHRSCNYHAACSAAS